MKILLHIAADTVLHGYEALTMAFALAAFDHEVQLHIDPPMLAQIMAQPQGKLANMLGSLALYDMSAAWLDTEAWNTLQDWQSTQAQSHEWVANFQPRPDDALNFDLNLRL